MRIACSVEYNGYGFCGWQKQPKTLTIQGLIEKALFEIAKKYPIMGLGAGNLFIYKGKNKAVLVNYPAERFES